MDARYITSNQAKQSMAVDTRSALEKIRKRAEMLEKPDKTLVRMYLENAGSFRQLAQLLGVNEVTIARRVRKILTRLSRGDFDAVLKTGSSRQKEIARDYFLHGLSVKAIAQKYNTTYYYTRQILKRIRTKSKSDITKYKTKIRSY